jgi:hypothetical protein
VARLAPHAGTPGFSGAVRLVPGAANPVVAGMILQTIAVQYQLGQIQRELETVNAKLDLLLEASTTRSSRRSRPSRSGSMSCATRWPTVTS